jgi:uncharacterized protein YjbI with pentapeptide repeats
MSNRLSFEDSYRSLQRQDWLKDGEVPLMPSRPPRYDDETLGLEFFRTWLDGLKGADLTNMTLCRTYVARSQVSNVSFANSDLTESVWNWNDLVYVDFSGCDLSRVDFRGNHIGRCRFVHAVLTDTDPRCCSFEECEFEGAVMARTKLTRENGRLLKLSDSQKLVIDWQDEDGDEPDGG